MPKAFYTEKDIEALAQKGVQSLEVSDAVVLTELAYEKARQLGIKLVTASGAEMPDTPPSAPLRPYIARVPGERKAPAVASAPSTPAVVETPRGGVSAPAAPASTPTGTPGAGELAERIRKAVIAKLGDQVEATLLDAIIARVLHTTGMK